MTYAQDLQVALEGMVRASPAAARTGQVRGRRVRRSAPSCCAAEHRALLQTAARVVLVGKHGSLAEQVLRARQTRDRRRGTALAPSSSAAAPERSTAPPALEFFNGLGGFADGRPRIRHRAGRRASARRVPWVNVIANPEFGFLVSESGAGCTWCGQQPRESDDAVVERPGVRSARRGAVSAGLHSGALWTPTPGPMRLRGATYVARHGAGYSRFEHASHGHLRRR